eukprot:m.15092 g.15092  ORF g.15092 m.15092 type:complete len:314 (+) comp5277_c0_seq1:114-1055(+)
MRSYALLVLLGCALVVEEARAQYWGSSDEFCLDENCYEILGVDPKATVKDIKRTYRVLAAKNHPDQGGDQDEFERIARAYDVLKDEEMRKKYDELLQDPEAMYYHMRRYKKFKAAPKLSAVNIVIVVITVISLSQYGIAVNNRSTNINIFMANPRNRKAVKDRLLGAGKKKKNIDKEIEVELKKIAEDQIPPPDPWNVLWAQIVISPVRLAKFCAFNVDWFIRINIRKMELTESDKVYLISKYLNMSVEQLVEDEDNLKSWMDVEAWEKEKFDEEQERRKEQDGSKGLTARQKREKRWAKKMAFEGRQWVEDE